MSSSYPPPERDSSEAKTCGRRLCGHPLDAHADWGCIMCHAQTRCLVFIDIADPRSAEAKAPDREVCSGVAFERAPGRCGGAWVLAGTRMTISTIDAMYVSGMSPAGIRDQYPHLTIDQVEAAIQLPEQLGSRWVGGGHGSAEATAPVEEPLVRDVKHCEPKCEKAPACARIRDHFGDCIDWGGHNLSDLRAGLSPRDLGAAATAFEHAEDCVVFEADRGQCASRGCRTLSNLGFTPATGIQSGPAFDREDFDRLTEPRSGEACNACGWIHEGDHPPREQWRSWEQRAREAERVIAETEPELRLLRAERGSGDATSPLPQDMDRARCLLRSLRFDDEAIGFEGAVLAVATQFWIVRQEEKKGT